MTITRTLAPDQHPGAPLPDSEFARAAKGALGTAGIPLRRIAERLDDAGFHIAPATLSGWGNGVNIPDRTGHTLGRLLALERVLAAGPGELVRAYHRTNPGPWDMRHRARHPLDPTTREAAPGSQKSVLDARGCTNEGAIALVDMAEHHQIGDTRLPVRSDIRLTALALQPGVRSYWVTYTVDDKAPRNVVPGRGCSLGEQDTVDGPGYRVRAVELRLEHALGVGDTADFAFAVVFRRPAPDPRRVPPAGFFRVVSDPACRRVRLDLSFSPYERPTWVRWVVWDHDTQDRLPFAGMPVRSGDGHFGQDLTDPGLTAYGYLWSWPAALETAPPAWAGAR